MAATLYAEPPKAVVPLTPQRAYDLALEAQHRGTLPTIKGRCLHFLLKPHNARTPNIMRLYRALRRVESYGWPPRTTSRPTSQHAGEVAALPVAEMAVAA